MILAGAARDGGGLKTSGAAKMAGKTWIGHKRASEEYRHENLPERRVEENNKDDPQEIPDQGRPGSRVP
jgi:hypothetical protein